MREGEKRTQVVGGHDDAVFELDGDDGGARHDGRLCCGLGAAGLKVGGIIGAIDVVSGLENSCISCDGSGDWGTGAMGDIHDPKLAGGGP